MFVAARAGTNRLLGRSCFRRQIFRVLFFILGFEALIAGRDILRCERDSVVIVFWQRQSVVVISGECQPFCVEVVWQREAAVLNGVFDSRGNC
jgi:hypothetical protein